MSVSFNELAYRIFNIIVPKIGDDQTIDISEIKYDIENTRSILLKRRFRDKFTSELPEAIIQTLSKIEIESVNASTIGLSLSSTKTLMRTSTKVPKLMEKSSGVPYIKRISASTILSNNFTVVTPQSAIYSGNGKFNQKNIFCFYENDYLYFITNRSLYKGLKYIDLYAVFERPSKVFEFKNSYYSTNQNNILYDENLPYTDDSNYPVILDMIDDLEQIIIKNKLRIESSQPIDDINDASDTQRQIQNPAI